MTRKTTTVAWAIAGIAVALLFIAVFIGATGGDPDLPAGIASLEGRIIFSFGVIPSAIVGGLVASRRPENSYGWVLLAFAVANGLLTASTEYAIRGIYTDPGSLPAARIVALIGDYCWLLWLATTPFMLILFPTGRPPSPRWKWPLKATVYGVAAGLALGWGNSTSELGVVPIDNPLAQDGFVGNLAGAVVFGAAIIMLGSVVAGVVSIVIRYRKGTFEERLQIRWLASAGALLIVTFVYDPPGFFDPMLEATTDIALPVAVGIAIFKHRLYDIDVVINRTLVYGTLIATLGLVYLGGVTLLQQLLRPLTGDLDLAVAGSTLVVAALFNPARTRIRSMIDRRFYRSRYDARQILDRFAGRVRDKVELEALASEVADTVNLTMRPANVSVWIRPRFK
jgi:hypothetical protein